MRRVLIEVCAGSITDVATAKEAGADRVELNAALQLGGLTPSAATIRQAVEIFPHRIIVMSRPRAGGFCYSHNEWLTLLRDAEFALAEGAAGIAFGALTPAGGVDVTRVTEFVGLFGRSETVFHRAFDVTADWRAALSVLIDHGINRVMTSGQKNSAIEGRATIAEIVRAAENRIEVLVAGGVHPDNARQLITETAATQLHGTFSRPPLHADGAASQIHIGPNDYPKFADADLIRWTIALF